LANENIFFSPLPRLQEMRLAAAQAIVIDRLLGTHLQRLFSQGDEKEVSPIAQRALLHLGMGFHARPRRLSPGGQLLNCGCVDVFSSV
jgi:hypothetical protein